MIRYVKEHIYDSKKFHLKGTDYKISLKPSDGKTYKDFVLSFWNHRDGVCRSSSICDECSTCGFLLSVYHPTTVNYQCVHTATIRLIRIIRVTLKLIKKNMILHSDLCFSILKVHKMMLTTRQTD